MLSVLADVPSSHEKNVYSAVLLDMCSTMSVRSSNQIIYIHRFFFFFAYLSWLLLTEGYCNSAHVLIFESKSLPNSVDPSSLWICSSCLSMNCENGCPWKAVVANPLALLTCSFPSGIHIIGWTTLVEDAGEGAQESVKKNGPVIFKIFFSSSGILLYSSATWFLHDILLHVAISLLPFLFLCHYLIFVPSNRGYLLNKTYFVTSG